MGGGGGGRLGVEDDGRDRANEQVECSLVGFQLEAWDFFKVSLIPA